MPNKFNTGAVIYLKTGSPAMVVDHVESDGLVTAQWFTLDGALHVGKFPPECVFEETPMLKEMRARRADNMKARMLDGRISEVISD